MHQIKFFKYILVVKSVWYWQKNDKNQDSLEFTENVNTYLFSIKNNYKNI